MCTTDVKNVSYQQGDEGGLGNAEPALCCESCLMICPWIQRANLLEFAALCVEMSWQ